MASAIPEITHQITTGDGLSFRKDYVHSSAGGQFTKIQRVLRGGRFLVWSVRKSAESTGSYGHLGTLHKIRFLVGERQNGPAVLDNVHIPVPGPIGNRDRVCGLHRQFQRVGNVNGEDIQIAYPFCHADAFDDDLLDRLKEMAEEGDLIEIGVIQRPMMSENGP